MATISVIVPVYRVAAYLTRCTDSILSQTYADFELILVDDESPDECPAMCDALAEQDERIRVIHIPHGGLSAARNAGIEYALNSSESRYITFIDSDDWVHPRYLEWLYAAARAGGGTVAAGGFEKVNAYCAFRDTAEAEFMSPEQFYCRSIVNFIVAWGKLFPKECFSDIRFPAGKIHEDEFTVWKIMFRQKRIAYLSTPVYAYFQRADSIMGVWTPDRLVRLEAVDGQHRWIEENCGEAAVIRSKQRKAVVYAEEVRGMTGYGMPAAEIRRIRKALRMNIRAARKHLPVRQYKSVYRTAWPAEMKVLFGLRAVLRKLSCAVSK